VPVLVGLGVDEFSMNPVGIPRPKAVLRAIDLTEARELSAQALSARSSQDSRKLAQDFFQEHLQDNMP
jgi:phosphotransferase system enzyme I (PtsI)